MFWQFCSIRLKSCYMSDSLIKIIKQNINNIYSKLLDDLLTYQKGEKVQVTQDLFKGLEAIYITNDGLERCILLIKCSAKKVK